MLEKGPLSFGAHVVVRQERLSYANLLVATWDTVSGVPSGECSSACAVDEGRFVPGTFADALWTYTHRTSSTTTGRYAQSRR